MTTAPPIPTEKTFREFPDSSQQVDKSEYLTNPDANNIHAL